MFSQCGGFFSLLMNALSTSETSPACSWTASPSFRLLHHARERLSILQTFPPYSWIPCPSYRLLHNAHEHPLYLTDFSNLLMNTFSILETSPACSQIPSPSYRLLLTANNCLFHCGDFFSLLMNTLSVLQTPPACSGTPSPSWRLLQTSPTCSRMPSLSDRLLHNAHECPLHPVDFCRHLQPAHEYLLHECALHCGDFFSQLMNTLSTLETSSLFMKAQSFFSTCVFYHHFPAKQDPASSNRPRTRVVMIRLLVVFPQFASSLQLDAILLISTSFARQGMAQQIRWCICCGWSDNLLIARKVSRMSRGWVPHCLVSLKHVEMRGPESEPSIVFHL